MHLSIIIVLVLLGTVAPASPAIAESSPAAPETLATVPGEYRSLAAAADGGLFLLAGNGLTRVLPGGKVERVSLPPLPGNEPVNDWSDLARQGDRLVLTRFSTPSLYFLALGPELAWTVLPVTGLTAKRPNLAEIRTSGNRTFVLDAAGGTFEIDAGGKATRLPGKALPASAPDGKPVFLDPRGGGKGPWKVTDGEGRTLLERADPGDGVLIQALQVIGYHPDGRLVMLEIIGRGELASEHRVFTVKDGKALAPVPVPTHALNPMVRSHVLTPRGDLLFLAPGPATLVRKMAFP